MAKTLSSVLPIPTWWQLPFAMALAKDKLLPINCYLCKVNPIQSQSDNFGHSHWFNQMRFLCDDCHQSIAWQTSQFQLEIAHHNQSTLIQGVASSFYHFPYQQVMRDFKNSHQLDRLPLLVHAIRQLDKPPNCHTTNSIIVAVPTTVSRLTQRGFDPVTILVKYLSFHWQIPVFTGIGREERQRQQGLSREQRLTNTQNAFYFTELPDVPNIIVFDDVATTGATLQSLAQTLIDSIGNLDNYQIFARALAHG